MTKYHNLHTKRMPRTMNEAFGPYAELETEPNAYPFYWWVCMSVICAFALCLIVTQ